MIAATNADLKAAVKSGAFREDLYFRIAVVTLSLPPLRDRGEDIGLIAREFLKGAAVQNGRTSLSFAPDTLHAMNRYQWPGNVRELRTGSSEPSLWPKVNAFASRIWNSASS